MTVIVIAAFPFEISRVLLFGIIALACAYEICINFDRMLGIKVKAWVLYAFTAVQVVLSLTHCGIMAYYAWFAFAVCLSLFSGMLHKEVSGKGAVYTLAGLAYPCFPASMLLIVSVSSRWALSISLGMLSAVLCDIFALLGGMKFGRHKLAPDVSPNKTIEGSICGGVFSLLAGLLVWIAANKFFSYSVSLLPCLVTAIAASTAGQVGDLAESMLKRYIGCKDMSNLIPGHGGVMDRMDSVLFSIPTAYFCLYAFGL